MKGGLKHPGAKFLAGINGENATEACTAVASSHIFSVGVMILSVFFLPAAAPGNWYFCEILHFIKKGSF